MIDVTCAIILIENKVLVTQRSETMKLPLKWEFPGGKLEKNELEIDCIKRELKEELNIDVNILRKLSNNIHSYGEFEINLIPYIVEYLSGEIKLAEHEAYQLVEFNQLEKLDWAEADIPILKELLNTQL